MACDATVTVTAQLRALLTNLKRKATERNFVRLVGVQRRSSAKRIEAKSKKVINKKAKATKLFN